METSSPGRRKSGAGRDNLPGNRRTRIGPPWNRIPIDPPELLRAGPRMLIQASGEPLRRRYSFLVAGNGVMRTMSTFLARKAPVLSTLARRRKLPHHQFRRRHQDQRQRVTRHTRTRRHLASQGHQDRMTDSCRSSLLYVAAAGIKPRRQREDHRETGILPRIEQHRHVDINFARASESPGFRRRSLTGAAPSRLSATPSSSQA